MKITELLRTEYVLAEMKAGDKREALVELAGALAKGVRGTDAEAMLQVVLDRERLGSTGIGDGIAIPHGKLAGLTDMVVAFGRSRKGIAFEALDGKPVHLFFLLLAPENSAGQHLKTLAKISRMLRDEKFRKSLLEAAGQEAILRIITEKDDET